MRRLFAVAAGAGAMLLTACAWGADGKSVYAQVCAACHTTGVAGAPRLGDREAWAPRARLGPKALAVSVLKGKGGMPPKGGNASITDEDARAAMEYMLGQAR